MNAVLPVARDYGALKRAMLELLEEARQEPERRRAERMAQYAENAEQMLAGMVPKRTLADGYFARVYYLLELESVMQLGVKFSAAEMDVSEMHGLAALAAARRQFDVLHPPCKRCGVRLENEGQTQCQDCFTVEAAANR
jgi:hypothetical protein